MAKRFLVFAGLVCFGLSLATGADARGRDLILADQFGLGDANIVYGEDLERKSSGVFRAQADTVYFGGINPATGLAKRTVSTGGAGVDPDVKWDWDLVVGETDPLQGWTSEDNTGIGIFVRRRVGTDFNNDPNSGLITNGGQSTASIWFGAHEPETAAGCWPGGQGYSNDWGQNMSKTFTLQKVANHSIAFNYFVDSESNFDYAYVYVVDNNGIRSPPLNTSLLGGRADGLGYSGSNFEGRPIGSPTNHAEENITVDASHLPDAIGLPFEVLINFESDPLFSDGLDSFAGFLNSWYGPMGVDDVRVADGIPFVLNDLSTFESGANGWSFFSDPPIGTQMKAVPFASVDEPSTGCNCPLDGNILVASIVDGSDFPHPKRQSEDMQSNVAALTTVPTDKNLQTRIVTFGTYLDLPQTNGVGIRVAMHYYPWFCFETLTSGWTIEPADPSGGFNITVSPVCGTFIADRSTSVPAILPDSLKVVIQILSNCDDFGTQDCTGPEQTNQSPYIDNVRICLTGTGLPTPLIARNVSYQDVFAQTNTLLASETVQIHSHHDNNRADMDRTNAAMGDSATVNVVEVAGFQNEAYLNFRVYPGPSTNTGAPFFSKYGGGFTMPGGSWAKARMDTATTDSGIIAGRYATYDYPNGSPPGTNGAGGPRPRSKIIPDGVLTPGTTVEYFFSANFASNPTLQTMSPDTTNQTYLEFEVLPGYYVNPANPAEILGPCNLYVDAFGADLAGPTSAQRGIELKGLRPFFGSIADPNGVVHQNWDRYDYVGSGGNTPGPLARESAGDNGMSNLQSMFYRTILFNTGSFLQEGLRDGDAALLINWLINDDFDRWDFKKGLWLSGNGLPNILNRTGRTTNNFLLSSFAEASLLCDGDAYREAGCNLTGVKDATFCVRLDPNANKHFPASALSYASVRGNGCPNELDFNVISATGDSKANLDYVDQDVTGFVTPSASVSNNQFAPGNPANWGLVLDAFSVHYLRSTPNGWTGTDCLEDSTAIGRRVSDVMTFLGASVGGCSPSNLLIGVDGDGPLPAPIARTLLFQNTPNPFNPQTTIRYQLHDKALVKLQIFDVSGKLVRTLVDALQETNQYTVNWDGRADTGREVSSGVYWARMSTSLGFNASTKMVVLK